MRATTKRSERVCPDRHSRTVGFGAAPSSRSRARLDASVRRRLGFSLEGIGFRWAKRGVRGVARDALSQPGARRGGERADSSTRIVMILDLLDETRFLGDPVIAAFFQEAQEKGAPDRNWFRVLLHSPALMKGFAAL